MVVFPKSCAEERERKIMPLNSNKNCLFLCQCVFFKTCFENIAVIDKHRRKMNEQSLIFEHWFITSEMSVCIAVQFVIFRQLVNSQCCSINYCCVITTCLLMPEMPPGRGLLPCKFIFTPESQISGSMMSC